MNAQKRSPLISMLSRLKDYLRTADALRLLIIVATTVVIVCAFVLSIAPARYDIRVGQVPSVTIAATKDVVDEVTTEQRRVEAADAVSATYKYQEGVTESVLSLYDQIFAQLRAVRQYGSTLPARGEDEGYTAEELDYAGGMLTLVTLRDYQITTLLNTDQEALEELYKTLYDAIKNTMSGHVTQGQESEAVQSISMIVGFRTDTGLLQNVVQPVLKATIQPNMVIDKEATEKSRQAARDAVDPTIYKQGQNIVVKGGSRVSVSQIRMLQTLGLIRSGTMDWRIYLGAAMLVVSVMAAMYTLLKLTGEDVMKNTRRLLLLSVILLVTLFISIIVRYAANIYLAPVVLCAMLASAMLSLKTGVICNAAMAILVSSLSAGSGDAYTPLMVNMITMALVSGTIAAMMMSRSAGRVRALITGVAAAGINFLIMLAFGMMTADSLSGTVSNGLWGLGAGALAGVLSIALQPLLEVIFNLPTPMKLLELSNPNSPLLRRLMLEAPGTYHHSVLVANLAEASAEAVDANPLLARVGAYYHDIGKLKRPLYFKENQLGTENAHDHTDPQVSAAILTAHARDGVMLAKAYHLPYEIQKIIAEHHGNTPVMYFYHKALQQANGKPVDIDNFRYDGVPPTMKESAIIMLSDTIEAAVRSQQSTTNSTEELENYLVKLVRGKLADGQLNNAPLTLSDIDKICIACATVLKGVYHERVSYPDDVKTADKPKTFLRRGKREEKAGAERMKHALPLPEAPAAPKKTEDAATRPISPEPVDEARLVVAPPPAEAPVPIEQLIQLEPLPKVDLSEIEMEDTRVFNAPEDEPTDAEEDKEETVSKTQEE